MSGVSWTGFTPARPWVEQLPSIVAERSEWERVYLPKLRAYDKAQADRRESEEKERVEALRALAWCRANGSPHKDQTS